MNAIRRGWEIEVAGHEIAREEWRLEQQQHAVVEEKWKLQVEWHKEEVAHRIREEEEERQKLNMFWGNVEAHTCITYGTREYTAQLMNLPTTWEHPIEACKATAIEIHGNSYLPKSCEDKGPGVVIGRWEVNQHEPDCASFWIWYKDKEGHFRSKRGT
ncbi:hypothetical protein JVU11DRAFT_11351 [Chiua virens]|nr:hypothetical protein JVU11DRAFT_11351 [Chiua virens]